MILKALLAGNAPLVLSVVALVFGLTVIGVGTERYFAGKSAGVAQDKARSDKVIAKMVEQHRDDLDAANARTAQASEELRQTKERMQREYTALQVENRRRLASVVAERDGLREQLSTYASGGVEASRDSVEACRDRAASLGRVLDRVVQDYAVCTGAAEDNAEGVRTLQVWSDTVERRVREAGAQQ